MIKCKECKYCEFSEGNGDPNRYYCTHKDSPSRIKGTAGATLICKTERRAKEFTIKKTPKWCPLSS